MINQAVILAGGKGTRLGPLTSETPKPILPVGGKPFLNYQIWNLKRHGIKNLLITVGYLAEKIKACLGDGSKLNVNIEYFEESTPMGTGGALAQLSDKLDKRFLVLNGDTILDMNYLDFAVKSGGAEAAIALRHVEDKSQHGTVIFNEKHITGFFEKAGTEGPGWINGGVYLLSNKILNLINSNPYSLETDLFPDLIKHNSKSVSYYKCNGFFLDIGLVDNYHAAQTLIPEWQYRPAAIFDRDGVINVDHGYVHKKEEFEWIEDAISTVKWFNDNGYLTFLVTNQAGIARGYYTDSDFDKLTGWMASQMASEGAHFDGIYYCPHHPTEGKGKYLKDCEFRKPGIGMLKQIEKEWNINKSQSIFIGDSDTDILAADRFGIRSVKYKGGSLISYIKHAI